MATLIDPPEHFYNHNTTGFPPVPPEAHQKANFGQKYFIVAETLRQDLSTGNQKQDQLAIHKFMTLFVSNQLRGSGFWVWGNRMPMTQCQVCLQKRPCIELIWVYK